MKKKPQSLTSRRQFEWCFLPVEVPCRHFTSAYRQLPQLNTAYTSMHPNVLLHGSLNNLHILLTYQLGCPAQTSNWGPVRLILMGVKNYAPGVKRLGREANHSPPSSPGIMDSWRYTSLLPRPLTGWFLVTANVNFHESTIHGAGVSLAVGKGNGHILWNRFLFPPPRLPASRDHYLQV
jgi:hypothetical protein